MIHDKAIQAISMVFYSILCAFIPVDRLASIQQMHTPTLENVLVLLQILSVLVFLIIGLWKFKHYIRDRKRNNTPSE